MTYEQWLKENVKPPSTPVVEANPETVAGQKVEPALTRKSMSDYREPMPEEEFNQLKAEFESRGGEIQMDENAIKYLDLRGAEGLTFSEDLIFLRPDPPPSRATVYEELIHAWQFRRGKMDGTQISLLKAEIVAKKLLIRYSARLGLTDAEIKDTIILLEEHERELESL